ncbi:MAG: MmgE/PrpD family protein [Candidatus Rokuibacteriota bacterium]|nr:MAG: MmgE/PrpD family protein [Candidatus Rokubacteria bacterium]
MSAIARIAEFVVKTRLDDCPREAIACVRRAALDSIGVMLAGSTEPVARIVREIARAEGGTPLCTVVGSSLRTSPTWAALANGAAGHAHDFDDTSFALLGHPSVPLLAAALAAAEAETADGAAVTLAYLIGFEVDAAIGSAINPDHYTRGWHSTATIGTLGCAAAAARLLALDPGQAFHALGLAASLASGLKENFGSMTKPYHAGHAARNGVLAALLAREGLTASESALDGKQGFLVATGTSPVPAAALANALNGLGQRWHVVESGVAVKPYPSCALTHSAIDALLELRTRHRFTADQISDIEVGVNHVVPSVLIHPAPTTALERKFSMQFCAAAAAAEGRVDLASFEGAISEPVGALMARVKMVVDPALPDRLEQHAWSRVTVRLGDGRTLASPARGATGHHDQPLTDEALRAKFFACCSGTLAAGEAEGVVAQLEHLEAIPDIRALTSRLVADRD